jgi:hypothetical protein
MSDLSVEQQQLAELDDAIQLVDKYRAALIRYRNVLADVVAPDDLLFLIPSRDISELEADEIKRRLAPYGLTTEDGTS